ncbi:hypothetical protein HDV03_003994 [Kappamyces sp. JEL0829]|nr:hypothetical protein HDV03_003994 [Kappamyces sp. JEL0829]
MLGLAGLVIAIVFLAYIVYRRATASSRKYKQTNPYVATISLQERYGGLEKRAVSIDDLSSEQLVLLERDGKLTAATVDKLRKQGRLPDPTAVGVRAKGANTPTPQLATPTSPIETPTPLPGQKNAPTIHRKSRKKSKK